MFFLFVLFVFLFAHFTFCVFVLPVGDEHGKAARQQRPEDDETAFSVPVSLSFVACMVEAGPRNWTKSDSSARVGFLQADVERTLHKFVLKKTRVSRSSRARVYVV